MPFISFSVSGRTHSHTRSLNSTPNSPSGVSKSATTINRNARVFLNAMETNPPAHASAKPGIRPPASARRIVTVILQDDLDFPAVDDALIVDLICPGLHPWQFMPERVPCQMCEFNSLHLNPARGVENDHIFSSRAET